MFIDQRAEQLNVARAVVQCRNVMHLAAARGAKFFCILQRDFFQRLQAVDGEARAQYIDAPCAGLAKRGQREIGIGLEPARRADPRLKAHAAGVAIQPQRLAQQACGRLALAVIGVAGQKIFSRQAMERQQQMISTRPCTAQYSRTDSASALM